MQLDQILKAAVAAVNEEDVDKIEIPNVDDLVDIANSGVNIPQKDSICYAGDETSDTQLDNTMLDTLQHELVNNNQEEVVPNFEDALGLANVEFDFKMKSSEVGTAELPQDNDLSDAHVSADMPLLDIEDDLIGLPSQSQLDAFSNDNCENSPFESISIPSAEINPQIAIDNAIDTFTQEDFPKLLSGVVNQESAIRDPIEISDPVEMSFFALDDENLVITSQQALEMFENTSEEAMAMVHHQDQFEAGSKERIPKAPVNYIENGYNDKLKYKNMNHIVNHKDNNNIDINALAHEVYQQHCNDMDKKQKMYLQNSKTYSKARNCISQDVFNAIEASKNSLSSGEVLTTLEPVQYTSLAPVSFDNSLQESALPSLSPDIPDGSTLDATVDENGQFVVKVVAPGMNMSVPNQYVSQCVQKAKQNNTNMVNGSSRQPYMKKKNYKLNNGDKLYPEFVKINKSPKGVLEEMKIKNEGSDQSKHFNKQHSQVLMALRESIYKSKAKRKSEDPSIENLSKRSRILNPSISEQDIKHTYPSNPIIFKKESVNKRLDTKSFDYMDNYNNNELGYQSLPDYKVQEGYRRNCETKVRPRKDMKVLDPNEISAALQGRPGGQNPLVFMKPQEIQTGEGEDPLQVQLVYLVYPLENNDNEAEPANGHPYKIQESQRPQAANPYPPRKDFNSHIPQEDPYQSHQEDPFQSSQQAPYEELKSSNTSDYLRIPIREWSFSEVVTFMSKNQENLNIKINFSPLSGITGRELINLRIEELERVAPGHGYQLFRILHEFMKTQDAQMQYARRTLPSMNGMAGADELYQQYNPPGNYYENKNNLGNTYVINPTLDNIMDMNQQGNQHVVMPTQNPKDFYQEFQNPGIMYNYGKSNIGSMDTMNVFSNQSNMFYQDRYDDLSDPDRSDNEDDTPAALPMPIKRGPGRPRKPENELKKKKKKTGRLWEFIRNLLHDPETCPSLVKWECPEEGVFRFVQAEKVAKMWGMRKLNTDMNYEKLSRAMRYYYKGGIFEAVLGRRLVYKFGKHAKGWQPSDPNFPDFQR